MGQLFRRASIMFALAIAIFCTSPMRAAEPVDLLLVLAADVSRSVDRRKFQLQREGYAAALVDPRVLDVIQSGRRGRIGVLFLEWSGFGNQKVVIDWMLIDGPKAAQAFGDRLLESPRSFADRTSISGGIDAAVAQLARAPFDAERHTIDVSGDGTNNAGRDVGQAATRHWRGYRHQRPSDPERIPLPWKSVTQTRPEGWRKTTETMSPAGPPALCWRPRTSTHSVRRSSKRWSPKLLTPAGGLSQQTARRYMHKNGEPYRFYRNP